MNKTQVKQIICSGYN